LTFRASDDGIVKLNIIKWRWFLFKYVCKYYRINSNGDDNIKIEDDNKKMTMKVSIVILLMVSWQGKWLLLLLYTVPW
jgi:uncharacterized protein YqhQ